MTIHDGFPMSDVIHFLPNFSAAAAVVPDPQKKSATRPPSGHDALIILSRSASGFWVA